MNPRFNDLHALIVKISKLYEKGMSVNDITLHLELPKYVVSFILKWSKYDIQAPKVKNSPDEKDISKMAALYDSGMNISEITNELNYSRNTIKKYLEKTGVKEESKNLSAFDILRIKKLADSGLSSRKIAKELGVSKSTVLYHVDTKRPTVIDSANVNSNYFDNIDTQEKAYWLGLMYSDGSVGEKDKSLTLSLTDEGLVKAFKRALESEHNISVSRRSKRNPNWKDSFTLKICNKRLYNALVKHGCIPNKTYSLKLPDLPEDLYRHFIRGIFDGDGSVWGKEPKGYFSITGYLPFMDKIQDILVENAGVSKTKLAQRKPDFGDIRYGGKSNMKNLYNYLYSGATCFLKRKHDKFKELLF